MALNKYSHVPVPFKCTIQLVAVAGGSWNMSSFYVCSSSSRTNSTGAVAIALGAVGLAVTCYRGLRHFFWRLQVTTAVAVVAAALETVASAVGVAVASVAE